jgi:hypothetical protein
MAWTNRFEGSKYTPGEWRKGLTSILFRKVAYVDKRHKYGSGMEPDELVIAELIKLLDKQETLIGVLSLRLEGMEKELEAIQPEVGGDVDERIPVEPAQTKARNARGRFERTPVADHQLVGQQR